MSVVDRSRVARAAGLAGLAGSACWLMEGLVSPPGGQTTLSSLLNIAAFTLIAVLIAGLYRLGAAAWGRFGGVAVLLWAAGYAGIAVATVISMAAGITDDQNPAFAVGGLLQVVGGLIAAIAITRGAVLTGWRRWMPLLWTLYFIGLVMPFGFSGKTDFLTTAVLVGWAVPIVATSVAVLTVPAASASRVPSSAPLAD